MKPSTLLKQQHRKVITALKKMERADKSERVTLLDEVSNDLAAHMAIEQEIFYPVVAQYDEETISEAYEEHALAELALKRLRATEPDSEAFRPRVVALRELLEHHIEEEEGELFPTAEKKIEDDDLDAYGERMRERFNEVAQAGFDAAVPEDMDETSADIARLQATRPGKEERAQPPLH